MKSPIFTKNDQPKEMISTTPKIQVLLGLLYSFSSSLLISSLILSLLISGEWFEIEPPETSDGGEVTSLLDLEEGDSSPLTPIQPKFKPLSELSDFAQASADNQGKSQRDQTFTGLQAYHIYLFLGDSSPPR